MAQGNLSSKLLLKIFSSGVCAHKSKQVRTKQTGSNGQSDLEAFAPGDRYPRVHVVDFGRPQRNRLVVVLRNRAHGAREQKSANKANDGGP